MSSLAKELGPKTVDPLSKQLKEDVGKLTPTNYGITDDPCRPLDLSDSDMQIINDSALMKEHSVIARQADAILTQELRESGHYRKTGQAYVYAISLPVFGTNGEFDNQTQLVIIRLIQAMDSITTDTYLFTKGFVDHVIGRMEKEVSGVSKISYDGMKLLSILKS